jgi:hypothetical protein
LLGIQLIGIIYREPWFPGLVIGLEYETPRHVLVGFLWMVIPGEGRYGTRVLSAARYWLRCTNTIKDTNMP